MIPAIEIDDARRLHDLPLELRRASAVHRSEDGLDRVVTGVFAVKERDEVIPPHLLRERLVVAAYPFRARAALPRETC